MKKIDHQLVVSATDLVNFLKCEHLTTLDRLALDNWDMQRVPDQAATQLLQQQGFAHEAQVLDKYHAQWRRVCEIGKGTDTERAAQTLAAMNAGVDVIFQGTFIHDGLLGHTDFLERVAPPARHGLPHRYRVIDTKLSRQPRAAFLVQLAFYSQLLETTQGAAPDTMGLILGDRRREDFPLADYRHYFAALLQRFRARLAGGPAASTYPEPCQHCSMCGWRELCKSQREQDDDLSLVVRLTRKQRARLIDAGITTLAALAETATPPRAVAGLDAVVIDRLAAQARLQQSARLAGEPRYELLPLDPDGLRGFHRLPAPDRGDMFFDLEGDPHEPGGLDYLFGVWYQSGGAWRFKAFWAFDRAGERAALEKFFRFVDARRKQHPGAHVYHYAHYEKTALARMTGTHARCEAQFDQWLRDGVLVDLYKVVREALRTSEPNLSIKSLERIYQPVPRAGAVTDAGASIVAFHQWRATGNRAALRGIRRYNRDDVASTHELRDWLQKLRADAFNPPPAFFVRPAAAEQATDEGDLTGAEPGSTQELINQLRNFHQRADRPVWWAWFARLDFEEAEAIDDPECLGGLQYLSSRQEKRRWIHEFSLPAQDSKLRAGRQCTILNARDAGGKLVGATIRTLAPGRLELETSLVAAALPARPMLGPTRPLRTDVLRDAIARYACRYARSEPEFPAITGILRRCRPRVNGITDGARLVSEGEDIVAATTRVVLGLDHSHLFVQGPPGAGKTYTAARVIHALLKAGKRVAITSNSHKAIDNLLLAVVSAAEKANPDTRLGISKKVSNGDAPKLHDWITNCTNNDGALETGFRLVAGTAWLLSRPEAEQRFDYLFVDEAGQVALANLVAAGTCARNIVLMGDQMQLAQPIQGVHPGESGASVLDYLLEGKATIAPERGIFLPLSWRMHPKVCSFISDAVYEGRLQPAPVTAQRVLRLAAGAHPALREAGISYLPVEHQHCSQSSQAEADEVAAIVKSLLQQQYVDDAGCAHPIGLENILVVSPYNLQVNLLSSVLPAGARVGTVDKFQGQEAEVVIVSMATSSQADLPRDIDFLYSKNRLNVAISRARSLAVLVASPALLSIKCSTPAQMALVNTLCWAAEVGRDNRAVAPDALATTS